ncbi:MAG: sugar phosphate nucleotidyltransferase [Candidatus Latescibacterota bacterium]
MSAPDVSRLWAVIPVAGTGTRLRPHTHSRPKPLLHVAGQPIIGHILDQLLRAGVRRVVFVIGHLGEQVLDYVRSRRDFTAVESVAQEERLGLGHAVSLTQAVVDGDPVLIVYGDTIFQADLAPVLATGLDGMVGVKQVDDPRRFGVVVQEDGRIVRLLEKPEEFVSDAAIVGVNYIRTSGMLFDCLATLMAADQRTRGEFQLTDALQLMVERGAALGTFPVTRWFDCGTYEALLVTNQHLLEGVLVPPHAQETVIIPPVFVDPTARVSRCVLGPYVSVGAGAEVERVVARNTIVGAGSVVHDALLEDTLIGHEAVVAGGSRRLNVGDQSEITG